MFKPLPYFFSVFLLLQTSIQAQIPAGYYDGTSGLTGEALWSELHSIIQDPVTVTYSDVDNKFVELGTDEDPNNSNNIIFFYMRDSRLSSSFTGNGDGSDFTGGWNKEHIWPRSRGVGDTGDDQQDMHMLRPTDVDVNSRRGNLDFGLVSGNNTANGSYFEPHDEVKGDVARILFYMITCYKGSLELVETVTNSSNQLGNLSLMLQWHENDPVDDFELSRNNKVYNYQLNRNPFVDHPEWVDDIWGEGSSEPTPEITVSRENGINFGTVVSGSSSAAVSYSVSGSDLTGDVVVSVGAPFELSLNNSTWSSQVTILESNAEAGFSNTVYVRFSPSVADGASYNEIISHTSENATTVNLSVIGFEGTNLFDDISEVRAGENGAEFTIQGIVTSPELHSTQGHFFVQDETAGVFIYYQDMSGLVSSGDKVRITGMRAVNNNQVELLPSSLEVVSSNENLPTLSDITESDITSSSLFLGKRVRLSSVVLTNTTNWPVNAGTSGVNIPARIGTTDFVIRIDENSYYNGTAVPSGELTIEGVLDTYYDDVQLFPFYDGDIQELVDLNPALTLDPNSINFPEVELGSFDVQSFVLEGIDLTENVTLTSVDSHYALSNAETGPFSSELIVGATGGVVNASIYVRFTAEEATSYSGLINAASSEIEVNLPLSGAGIEPQVTHLEADVTAFDFGEIGLGALSQPETVIISGANLWEDVAISTTGSYKVSDLPTSGYSNSLELTPENGAIEDTLYVVFSPASLGFHSASLKLTSSGITETISLVGQCIEATSTLSADPKNEVRIEVKNGLLQIAGLDRKTPMVILDTMGHKILAQPNSERVDVSSLSTGLYFFITAEWIGRFLVP